MPMVCCVSGRVVHVWVLCWSVGGVWSGRAEASQRSIGSHPVDQHSNTPTLVFHSPLCSLSISFRWDGNDLVVNGNEKCTRQ
ncbi:MAG: hypothetical protein BYD32DRAFT_428429 [Podila humilis]|nr:MAG: hypothetical protein BYD32DRAFT_428429 [Podila humilis]